jgi:phosphoglycolate phosphatase
VLAATQVPAPLPMLAFVTTEHSICMGHQRPVQVGAIKGSTKREPTVVGKPEGFMLQNIASNFGLQPSQICMVGDRLDTDVMFGKNGGLTTALVLSGVTTEEELMSEENHVHPDFCMDQLSDLLTIKGQL